MTEIIKGECSVELLRENEDGSADYAFNFPPEALQALTKGNLLCVMDRTRLDRARVFIAEVLFRVHPSPDRRVIRHVLVFRDAEKRAP